MQMKTGSVNIDEVIKSAAKEAVKEYDKELKEKQKKTVFHNTRLLLKHYNDLKSHMENAVDDIYKLKNNELDFSDYIDMDKCYDELYIASLKRSKVKTLMMVAHIDMAMEALRNKQVKLYSIEKYKSLEQCYFEEKTYEEIAEDLNCSVVTARRWVNEMVKELSILLFGIDGLRLELVR